MPQYFVHHNSALYVRLSGQDVHSYMLELAEPRKELQC
jgi:hypothetical protein